MIENLPQGGFTALAGEGADLRESGGVGGFHFGFKVRSSHGLFQSVKSLPLKGCFRSPVCPRTVRTLRKR